MKLLNPLKDLFVFLFSTKIFLSLGSFYLFLLFYFISNKIHLFNVSALLNYVIYFTIGFVFSSLCLLAMVNKKEIDHQDKINSIRPLEFAYIPAYLGLVIISLALNSFSTDKIEVVILSSIIYLIWVKLENVSFFNFYWLFFGYRFYDITTKMSNYILISKRKDVKNCKTINDLKLKRINNYTFIEVENKRWLKKSSQA